MRGMDNEHRNRNFTPSDDALRSAPFKVFEMSLKLGDANFLAATKTQY